MITLCRRRAQAFVLLTVSWPVGCGMDDGGYQAAALDERLQPGQVRAGVITRLSELLDGPEAHGWLGDFKLYNDRVAFVVQNAFEPRGWGPFGGSLLDADRIRSAGAEGNELFQELFLLIEMRTIKPTAAELVSDGSDGQPALVRIEGVHHGVPLIDGATEGMFEPLDLEVVHEYQLAADADHLVVRTRLRVRSGPAVKLNVGDALINGDQAVDFVPGQGEIHGPLPVDETAYIGGISRDSCNLYTSAAGSVRPNLSIESLNSVIAAADTAPQVGPGVEPLVVERFVIVGQGGMDDCLRKLRKLRGDEDRAGWVAGAVSHSDGAAEAAARIAAHDLSLPAHADLVDQTFSAADGSFELELEPGTYRIEAHSPGREAVSSEPFEVLAGQTTAVDLQVPVPARLAFACRGRDRQGGDTGALPCKVSLQAGHDAAMDAQVATEYLTFAVTGQGELLLPPGDWTITFSRGWEHTIDRHSIRVESGGRAAISAVLTHQVDTDGYISADLHSHSTRSPDSEFEIFDKLGSNVTEGLELLVLTDHDCQMDLAPWVERLEQAQGTDLGRWIRTVVGNEVSPLYAHLTAFPLPTHETGWIYWQIPWTKYRDGRFERLLEFPELWQRCRELGAEVINIAHPTSRSGYFTYLGFAPPEVMPPLDQLPSDKFSTEFDTMELLNGRSVGDMLAEVVPLWSKLNNQGLFRTAVGVSDSHGRDREAGFGCTMIASASDDPRTFDLSAIWENLRAGRAMVAGGIFVTIGIGQAGAGDLVQAGPALEVRVEVQAADWVGVSQLDLLANGEVIASHALRAAGEVDPDRPALRFAQSIPVEIERDTWFAALAYGDEGQRLDPVFRSCRPIGMTNAVRVDLDGNGRFDPPGL